MWVRWDGEGGAATPSRKKTEILRAKAQRRCFYGAGRGCCAQKGSQGCDKRIISCDVIPSSPLRLRAKPVWSAWGWGGAGRRRRRRASQNGNVLTNKGTRPQKRRSGSSCPALPAVPGFACAIWERAGSLSYKNDLLDKSSRSWEQGEVDARSRGGGGALEWVQQ